MVPHIKHGFWGHIRSSCKLGFGTNNHPNVGVGMCEDESWSLLGFEWAIARPTYYIKYCVKRHHVYLSCSIRNVNYCVVLLSLQVNLTLFVISCRNISTLYICSVANVVIYLCHAHTYWWESPMDDSHQYRAH